MKSPVELGLSKEEFNAFVKVRDMLAAKKVKSDNKVDEYSVADTFDMNASCAARDLDGRGHSACGTVMCIGGWVKLFMLDVPMSEKGIYDISPRVGNEISKYVTNFREEDAPAKHDLFYPPVSNWDRITPYRASKAITNFLETGKPSWSKALA